MEEKLNLLVAKFGGSSQSNEESCQNVVEIIKNSKPIAVIVSAPGKAHAEDIKVTDLLKIIYEKKKSGISYEHEFSILIRKFNSLFGKNRSSACIK